MKRRDFITLLGGAAAAWPLAARAQQGERVRRVGVLMNLTADDPESSARVTAFAQGLQRLGWTAGHNVRIDYRWGAGAVDADISRRYAAELVALVPDVILAGGSSAVRLHHFSKHAEGRFATTQHFGRFRSEADIDGALGRCGASWRVRAGGYFGSPEARGAGPGASLWHVWMALPKPEWIDPHRPITVEIAKLVNPHRALVSANINFLATGN